MTHNTTNRVAVATRGASSPASVPAVAPAPWAYTGTDDTAGVTQVPLTAANSLPAMVVWMTMTTSGLMQQTSLPAGTGLDTATLAQQTGLTEKSVIAIRSLVTQPHNAAAFSTVAQAFRTIGQDPGDEYPPSACPRLVDVLNFAPTALAVAPAPAGGN
jgi:hypothetical protein